MNKNYFDENGNLVNVENKSFVTHWMYLPEPPEKE